MLGADIAGARVALGKTGKTYILVADRSQAIAACQRILDAHGSRLQWPAGVGEVAAWVEAVLRAAAKGTGLAATSYNLKCVTRKALLLLSPAVYQGFLDGVQFKDIEQYMPDQCKHLLQVHETFTGEQFRNAFGMDMTWITCWSCMLGVLTEEEREALASAPVPQLLRLARMRSMSATEVVAPMPLSIARAVLNGE